ncbi:MAG: hypothetical protein JW741_12545 [Sedimentisphaerales bacterium]|nr:hypothetical protein [Sedimentisphaerales bacterium]
MESRFLTENRTLLRLCAGAARFCGLSGLGAIGVLVALLLVLTLSAGPGIGAAGPWRVDLLTKLPLIAFCSFVALVFAEFISFLLADEGEPKWLLRHGDKIIYAYVLYFIVVSIQVALQTPAAAEVPGVGLSRVFRWVFVGASVALHALIWLGIALVLRKVVSIVRESKTLV